MTGLDGMRGDAPRAGAADAPTTADTMGVTVGATVPLRRIVGPDGQLVAGAEVPGGLGQSDLIGLYRHMVQTRAYDSTLVHLQRQGQLSTYPPCLGQEAAQVGSAAALAPGDWVFPSYRELGCAVVRGVPVLAWGHAWRGTWFSDYDPYQHRFAPLSVPVGTNGLHAVGAALAAKLAGRDEVVAAYFGDGATSEGDVHEAMNLAAVFGVSCVFVVQNNGWAISTPTRHQYATATLAERAVGYGIAAWRCDGNDVLATFASMTEATGYARQHRRPAFVEAVTYRMGPHTTADNPTRYRDASEVDRWAGADPLSRYASFLQRYGVLDQSGADAIAGQADAAAVELRAALVASGPPSPLECFDHLFVTCPPSLNAQRGQLAAELAAWQAGTEAAR